MLNLKGTKSENSRGISRVVSVVIVVVVVAIALVGVFYISSSRSSPSSGSNISCTNQPNSAAVQVSILNGASNSANGPGYGPDSITLVIGTNNTVTWTNNDSVHHTVTTSSAPSGATFSSGDMSPGNTYTCTFSTPGTYKYYCTYHAWMTGMIEVEAAS
jgi:plastocyanin